MWGTPTTGRGRRLDPQHGNVRALGQRIERIADREGRQPHTDADLGIALDGGADRLEPTLGIVEVRATEAAHEFVAPMADDRVERAKARTDLAHDGLQDTVARGMTVATRERSLEAVRRAFGRRGLTLAARRVVADLICRRVIGVGRTLAVGRRLVPVRGDLVPVGAVLVGRRGGLVFVRERLVGVGGGSVCVRQGLVDVQDVLGFHRLDSGPARGFPIGSAPSPL